MSLKTVQDLAGAYPQKPRGARTPSNLRPKPRLPAESEEVPRFQRMAEKLGREYRSECRKLFTRKEAQLGAKIIAEHKHAWPEAAIKAGPESRKLDLLKSQARRKLQRQLARALPGYRKALALRREHHRKVEKLRQAAFSSGFVHRGGLSWGDITPFGYETFTEPFALFDTNTEDWNDFVTYNESFANRQIGHLVNNIRYDHDDSTDFISGLFGLLLPAHAADRVSCGINYTMARTGRLELGAAFQCLHNRISFSVHDNFGFSSASVYVGVSLFFAFVQGTRITYLPTEVLTTGLKSDGGEASYTLSELDDTEPYRISAVSPEPFQAGESLQILAGSEFLIASMLDDMHCKASALLWWSLKHIAVRIEGDPPVLEPR